MRCSSSDKALASSIKRFIIPIYTYAHVYHPIPKNITYLILAVCAIISFCIVGVIYEKGIIKRLIEEARALSDEGQL